jgi:hypothetical protein
VRDPQFVVIWIELCVAVRHIGPSKSWNRVSKTDREVITALERKGSSDALPGEEGAAVELKCQKCGKEWLEPV